jgi:hypothetical protein
MFSTPLFTALEYMCSQVSVLSLGRQNAITIVSIGSRLYTGEPEDEAHIIELRRAFGSTEFVRYDVASLDNPVKLHNTARSAGVEHALAIHRTHYGSSPGGAGFWTLFLDGDELPEADAFAKWFVSKQGDFGSKVSKLANYWYFIHSTLVSNVFEDSILLAHSSTLTPEALEHPRERDGIVACAGSSANRGILSLSGRPMFHHYSWVRVDEEALLRKVANWGHKDDKPWGALIHECITNIKENDVWPRNDFVHGYNLHRIHAEDIMFVGL